MKIPWDQIFPQTPQYTLQDVSDLFSKVFIVTGGSSGIGFELVKLLYQRNATVYIATRSAEKSLKAASEIKTEFPRSKGRLEFLLLDLADLTTIKKSANQFLAKEQRLDVLWNNAGVFVPPVGSKTAQGYELQLGTNCLGPFLFTHFLLPLLRRTASTTALDSVRVIWTGSLAIDMSTEEDGMSFNELEGSEGKSQMILYAQSKFGNLCLGSELAKRAEGEGVLSMTVNPGNIKSPMQRHMPAWERFLSRRLAYSAIYGAYTELYAGLSLEVTRKQNGGYLIPWGRLATLRPDIVEALRSIEEGGTGKAKLFWDFCIKKTQQYL